MNQGPAERAIQTIDFDSFFPNSEVAVDVAGEALSLLHAGDPTRARQCIKSLRYSSATAPEGYLLFVMLTYAREDKPRLALRYANLALASNPNHPTAMSIAADMTMRLGNLEEARHLALRATELHPRECAPWITLAAIQARRKDFTEAISLCEKALRISPSNPLALLTLPMLLFTADRASEAIGPLRKVLRNDPGHEEARLMLGIAQFKAGKYDAALRCFLLLAKSETLLDDDRISALTYAASCYLANINLRGFEQMTAELRALYGEGPAVRRHLESLDAAAAEVREELQTESPARVRWLRAVKKALAKGEPLIYAIDAVHDRVTSTWEEIRSTYSQIKARPINNRVRQSVQANAAALAHTEKVCRAVKAAFIKLEDWLDAAEKDPNFDPAAFLIYLSDLSQQLEGALNLSSEYLVLTRETLALQTRQLGH